MLVEELIHYLSFYNPKREVMATWEGQEVKLGTNDIYLQKGVVWINCDDGYGKTSEAREVHNE